MTNPTGWEHPDPVEPETANPGAAFPEAAFPEVVEPESVDPEVVAPEVVESEVVEPEAELDQPAEPDPADTVDAEIIEPPAEPSRFDLGDAAPEAPTATDFEVGTDSPPAPATPSAPPVSPPGGSWLDLPPMPDIPGMPPAPAPPANQGFTPLPGQGPYQDSNPPAAPQQQYTQPSFGAGYGEQLAGQAYGHGTPTPQAAPHQQAAPSQPGTGYQYPPSAPQAPYGQQAPYAPYGSPAGSGYGMQPYQYGAPDTTMASMAHWLSILIDFIGPLVILLTRGQQDPFVRANAVEALNFRLTLILGYLISGILAVVVIGVLGLIALPILGVIFSIIGALAASRGEVYRYPFRIPFVK